MVNAASLIAIAIFIFIEAYRRLPRRRTTWMAASWWAWPPAAWAVNLAGLWLLHGGREENLNAKGAWLHVLTDTLGSVQAVAAGALIVAFGWTWLDPVASVLIGILVFSSWALMRESVAVLMESAPGHVDVDEVRNCLMRIPGVQEVHDLHVWTIASGLVALSAHIAAERPSGAVMHDLQHEAGGALRDPSHDHSVRPARRGLPFVGYLDLRLRTPARASIRPLSRSWRVRPVQNDKASRAASSKGCTRTTSASRGILRLGGLQHRIPNAATGRWASADHGTSEDLPELALHPGQAHQSNAMAGLELHQDVHFAGRAEVWAQD